MYKRQALDCADGGVPVVLVERQPTIGGKMAKLDKTFPTVDCSACILGPKMVDVAQHPNITLYAMSEVEDVSGYVGNFTVKIRKRATYVDWSLCTGCGACTEKCPSKKTPDAFNEFTGPTTAINIAFPQAIPKKAVINPEYCRQMTKGKCGCLLYTSSTCMSGGVSGWAGGSLLSCHRPQAESIRVAPSRSGARYRFFPEKRLRMGGLRVFAISSLRKLYWIVTRMTIGSAV